MKKQTAWAQMCAALGTEKPKRRRQPQKPWRGGLADLATYGRKGLTKLQEAKHG